MISPASLGFPAHFTDWTPGQFATIAQVASHLAQPDAPITILEAPTGVGKSVIAEALIRLLKPQRAVILTGTKQLQEQYASAFAPALHNVMGRGNFPCLIDSSKTAADALCTVGYPCHLKKSTGPKNFPECPYFAQREQAQVAPEIVTNYPYWLAQANYAHKFKADLLICDEAHTLEEEVRRFASVGIRKSHIDLALGTGLPVIHTIGDWKTWAKETLADLKGDYREAQATKASLSSGEHKQHRAVISLYEACQQLADDADATDDNWVIEPQSWGVKLRPVWVSKYTERYVLRHARKVLCMSATILTPRCSPGRSACPPRRPRLSVCPPGSRKRTARSTTVRSERSRVELISRRSYLRLWVPWTTSSTNIQTSVASSTPSPMRLLVRLLNGAEHRPPHHPRLCQPMRPRLSSASPASRPDLAQHVHGSRSPVRPVPIPDHLQAGLPIPGRPADQEAHEAGAGRPTISPCERLVQVDDRVYPGPDLRPRRPCYRRCLRDSTCSTATGTGSSTPSRTCCRTGSPKPSSSCRSRFRIQSPPTSTRCIAVQERSTLSDQS
jgi:hypothetical protein